MWCARAHLEIARQLNYPPATDRLRALDARLTPDQRQAATAYEAVLRAALKPMPAYVGLQYDGAQPPAPPVAIAPPGPRASNTQTPPVQTPPVQSNTTASQVAPAAADRAVLTRADAHLNRNELELALADYDDLVRRGTTNWLVFNRRGIVYMRKGPAFYNQAIADYTKATAMPGHDAAPHLNRASISFERRDYAQAIAELDQAIDVHKVQDDAYDRLRGRAKLGARDYAGAQADFTKMIERQPDNVDGYYLRGLAKTNEVIDRVAYCEKEQLAERQRRATGQLIIGGGGGQKCAMKPDFDFPLKDLNLATSKDPKHADAHYETGRLLAVARKPDLAIQAFLAAIRANPSHADAMIEQGIIYLEADNKSRALELFNDAIKAAPNNQNAYANRANIYAFQSRRRSDAIRDFRRALEIDPSHEYSKAGLRRLGETP